MSVTLKPREVTEEKGKKVQIKMTRAGKQDNSAADEISLHDLKGMISQLTTTLGKLEQKIDRQPQATGYSGGNSNFRGRCHNRGHGNWSGHGYSGWNDRGFIRGHNGNRGRGTRNYFGSTGNYSNQGTSYSGHADGNHGNQKSNYYDVECFRCFQKCHVQSGCRV